MQKPKMLYASPFNPMQSGISDYSEVLVQALQKKYDITLLVKDYEMTNQELTNTCAVLRYDRDFIPFEEFDYVIYNIGNQPDYHDYIFRCCLEHPGLVILHEISIYYLMVGVHSQNGDILGTVYKQTGTNGIHKLKDAIQHENKNLLECKSLSSELPLNQEILQSDNKFMVHSEYMLDKILGTGYVKKKDIQKINLVAMTDVNDRYLERQVLFRKFNVPEDAFIISSFGFIDSSKLNHVICKSVLKLADELNQKICYVMVGKGNYVNQYVDGSKIIKTGYTELEEFNSFIRYSDIVINLRHPTVGETSAAVISSLGLGKPCITSNEGWFAEIPDACAVKLDNYNVEATLEDWIRKFIENPLLREEYGKAAVEYIQQYHNPSEIAMQIQEFLEAES